MLSLASSLLLPLDSSPSRPPALRLWPRGPRRRPAAAAEEKRQHRQRALCLRRFLSVAAPPVPSRTPFSPCSRPPRRTLRTRIGSTPRGRAQREGRGALERSRRKRSRPQERLRAPSIATSTLLPLLSLLPLFQPLLPRPLCPRTYRSSTERLPCGKRSTS